MNKEFIYKVLNLRHDIDITDLEESLTELGEQGWKLVSALSQEEAMFTVYIFIKEITHLETTEA